MCDGSSSPGLVFPLILFDKRADNLSKLVLVSLGKVHLMVVFDCLDIDLHHFWKRFGSLNGYLIELKKHLQARV